MSAVDWVVAGLLVLGLLGCLLRGAPEGYEDEGGFHYGKPPKDDEES